MSKYHIDLHSNRIYHVFNRATGNEKLFKSDENYKYFLKKYLHHISPVADTLSWCLLPNHFHIKICIKPEQEITDNYVLAKKKEPDNKDILPDFIM
jgi:REP element-mobilizing transposase RayT